MKLPKILVIQNMVLAIVTIAISIVIPVVIKMQGLYMPAIVITIAASSNKMANIILPLFKDIKLKYFVLTGAILDLLMSISFISLTPKLFIYIEIIFGILYSINSSILGIKYNSWVMESFGKEIFYKDSIISKIVGSVASILSIILMVIITKIINDAISTLMILSSIVLAISGTAGLINYYCYWYKINYK